MIRLRVGYLITGIITGCLLILSFLATIPDGKLHVVFCDVGQGDGIYVRFPDGKDLVIDGGPGNKIIGCLSRHMPFWDRTLDMTILTHPQSDHLNGLLTVLQRYQARYLLRSDITNTTEGFEKLKTLVKQKNITEKFAITGEMITLGPAKLTIAWPSKEQIAGMKPINNVTMQQCNNSLQTPCPSILGTTSDTNINDGSVVFSLSYGTFDALFMSDADSHVQPRMMSGQLVGSISALTPRDGTLELFKVPHHGSKTGLTDSFLQKISPAMAGQENSLTLQKPLAVISVGINSYGHPAPEIIQKLESAGFQVLRTDKAGDIEVVSDGKTWEISSSKN
jgi:competence protein ComEC